MDLVPAGSLEGLELPGGWKVKTLITPSRTSTGGRFSVGYIAEDQSGREAYVKTLDFSSAFQSCDVARELESMTNAYNVERDLLGRCKEHRLSKVVTPIADGTVDVPGNFGPLSRVCYLIFEKADGDIRKQYEQWRAFDLAWCLRSMHHTATGIRQLHSKGIAHQDLKPSNILVFKKMESKITDLGRASAQSVPSPLDKSRIAGDAGYAPPELFYDYKVSDDFQCRFATDIYLLGSLFFFYFANVSATQALKAKLKSQADPNFSGADFVHDLPYLHNAFYEAIKELRVHVQKDAGKLTDSIITMVTELCNPNPSLRGDPKSRSWFFGQIYSLERYVSRLNHIACSAEHRLI